MMILNLYNLLYKFYMKNKTLLAMINENLYDSILHNKMLKKEGL